MTLPQLPQDKASHVLYGLLAFCVFGLISPVSGFLAAVFIGAAKEAWDRWTGKGHVEWADFIATTAGGGAGLFCTFL